MALKKALGMFRLGILAVYEIIEMEQLWSVTEYPVEGIRPTRIKNRWMNSWAIFCTVGILRVLLTRYLHSV